MALGSEEGNTMNSAMQVRGAYALAYQNDS